MSELIARGKVQDAYLYAMLNYAAAEVRMPPEVEAMVERRPGGAQNMNDWQAFVRRYWAECCVVLGVVFLVAGLTGWTPVNRYSADPGFSGEARFLIALGAGLLAAGVIGRRKEGK